MPGFSIRASIGIQRWADFLAEQFTTVTSAIIELLSATLLASSEQRVYASHLAGCRGWQESWCCKREDGKQQTAGLKLRKPSSAPAHPRVPCAVCEEYRESPDLLVLLVAYSRQDGVCEDIDAPGRSKLQSQLHVCLRQQSLIIHVQYDVKQPTTAKFSYHPSPLGKVWLLSYSTSKPTGIILHLLGTGLPRPLRACRDGYTFGPNLPQSSTTTINRSECSTLTLSLLLPFLDDPLNLFAPPLQHLSNLAQSVLRNLLRFLAMLLSELLQLLKLRKDLAALGHHAEHARQAAA